MTNAVPEGTTIRAAGPADLLAMIAIAKATGQDEDWTGVFPDYIRHLMTYGVLLVAERAATVTGYGGTLRVGEGPRAVSMLTDLFVDPAVHGSGAGRALLGALWNDAGPRMTFSSLHANALPLYTSFGVDAWWPLLYVRGDVRLLDMPPGWSVAATVPESVAGLERQWTGADRTADHRFWAGWPHGVCVVASLHGRAAAAGTTGGAGQEFGVCHLASDPAISPDDAADGVVAVLSSLRPAGGQARVCLPAPHRATRALLRSSWRVEEYDLYMTSDPGLIDPYRLVPSAALA